MKWLAWIVALFVIAVGVTGTIAPDRLFSLGSLVATPAGLLAVAHTITQARDLDAARQMLLPLLETAPASSRHWVRKFLPGDGYCSPGLYTTLGPEIGAQHVIARTGIQPTAAQLRQPPPPPRP